MFRFSSPTDESVRALLGSAAARSFTYDPVGQTRHDLASAPAGFRLRTFGCDLFVARTGDGSFASGDAQALFEYAKERISRFGHYPRSIARVVLGEGDFGPGLTFAAVAHHFGFASIHPGRIIDVIDEPDRFGFLFGTLPGHVMAGEERFLVTIDPPSGRVRYEIQSFSKPADWFSSLGVLMIRRFQSRFGEASCEVMIQACAAGVEGSPRDDSVR